MKKLVSTVMLLTAMVSFSVNAEDLSEIGNNKAMQEAVSQKINDISSTKTTKELADYVLNSCESSLSTIEEKFNDNQVNALKKDCVEKVESLGLMDLETAQDFLISNIQERQSAANQIFAASRRCMDKVDSGKTSYHYFCDASNYVIALPVLMIIELVTLPLDIIVSAVTGF